MLNLKNLQISGLYKITKSDHEKTYKTLISAFRKYPKLSASFPDEKSRLAAVEATLRYYGAYDLRYGAAFSLDKDIREVCIFVHSDEMNYSPIRHLLAGSYSVKYRRAMKQLAPPDRKKFVRLFEELDSLETGMGIPEPHLYIDFLGTAEEYQHQGRGRRLMNRICAYADSVQLPIMLFTNTAEDVLFYQSLGFNIIGETSSGEFGFVNTYLIYTPIPPSKMLLL